jgi:GMP synthase (glutamine-hydrolysing)
MSAATAPRVAAIQHVSAEPLGTIAVALSAAGVEVDPVRVDLGDPIPETTAGLHGIVVMGGPMGVYEAEQHPFLRDELRLLSKAHEQGLPILGICLGAQLLAGALGSRVYPSGIREIGWYPITLTGEASRDALFRRTPQTFTGFHWHGDTFDLPPGAVRLASSKLTREQAFRAGPTSYGLQFHLEVTPEVVSAMTSGADAELSAAGTTAAVVTGGVRDHGEGLAAVGRDVFSAWAGFVRERAG